MQRPLCLGIAMRVWYNERTAWAEGRGPSRGLSVIDGYRQRTTRAADMV